MPSHLIAFVGGPRDGECEQLNPNLRGPYRVPIIYEKPSWCVRPDEGVPPDGQIYHWYEYLEKWVEWRRHLSMRERWLPFDQIPVDSIHFYASEGVPIEKVRERAERILKKMKGW